MSRMTAQLPHYSQCYSVNPRDWIPHVQTLGFSLVADHTSVFQGRRGRDHMVVGFITTYAISAYRH
jgi:hypothetical protein